LQNGGIGDNAIASSAKNTGRGVGLCQVLMAMTESLDDPGGLYVNKNGVVDFTRTPLTLILSGYTPARSNTVSGEDVTVSPGAMPRVSATVAPTTHSPNTAIGRPASKFRL
jgi:hypothetical protein